MVPAAFPGVDPVAGDVEVVDVEVAGGEGATIVGADGAVGKFLTGTCRCCCAAAVG